MPIHTQYHKLGLTWIAQCYQGPKVPHETGLPTLFGKKKEEEEEEEFWPLKA